MKACKIISYLTVLVLLCACGRQTSTEVPAQVPVPEEPPVIQAEPINGFVRDGDSLIYYIDDVAQVYAPGVQEIEGKFYLILEDGSICGLQNQLYNPGPDQERYYMQEDSSLKTFEQGLVDLPEGTYLASGGYALSSLSAEVGTVDGMFYAFGEDGRILELEPGIHELFQDGTYLAQPGTAALTKPERGLLHYAGDVYYIGESDTLVVNDTVGFLTFGADGRYTSGNADLDAAVKALLETCVADDLTDTEAALRAAYEYLRDNYRYLSGDFYPAGTTDWAEGCALSFLELGKGNCYCWAATLMYCARQLGYQAYVVGGWESNPSNVHAWTMIDWPDGETYLFDPQLEYAYWYMFSNKPQIDMFKASGDGLMYNGFSYYFPETGS